MPDDPELAAVRQLLELVNRFDLSELEVADTGLRVTVRAAVAGSPPGPAVLPPDDGAESRPAEGPEAPLPENARLLLSPMTVTFYRAPSPEMPPYAEVGMAVEEGQPVGVLEAMKVFSDVPADSAGRILEFRARNGQLVHEGDPLLVLELLAAT